MSTKISKRTTKVSPKLTETAVSAGAAATTGFDTMFFPGRRLTLSTFNGQNYVHIREYTRMDDGREYPTKKGVCLTPGRLSVLRGKLAEINTALLQQEVNASYGVTVEEGQLYKIHLGAGIYVSINEKYHGVSIRRYWRPEGQGKVTPTKNGIYLPSSQWKTLLLKLDELLAAHPELLIAQECITSHMNEMGMLDCYECMPFGWFT